MDFHRAWHQVRTNLEEMWVKLYPGSNNDQSEVAAKGSNSKDEGYHPNLADLSKQRKIPDGIKYFLEHYQLRHCRRPGAAGYKKLRFPASFYNPLVETSLLWK